MSSDRQIELADESNNVTTVNVSEKDGRGSTRNEWKGGIKERKKAPQRRRSPLFSPNSKRSPRTRSRVGTSQSSKERHQAKRREEPKKGMM
jgi:hypothetical protein